MIVLAYYNQPTSGVTRFTVLPAAPATLPVNSAVIPMSNVPEAFFESFDEYRVNGSNLVLIPGNTGSKRITTIAEQSATVQSKINSTPYARQRIAKTGIFACL